MRGEILHNTMGKTTGATLQGFFSEVYPEYKYCRNGTVTYLDLFARQSQFVFAFEIETTARHGVDNAIKATAVDIPLWIIVPNNKVKVKLLHKLKPLKLRPGGKPIKILLLGQLQRELEECPSLKPLSNQQTDISVRSNSKGGNLL